MASGVFRNLTGQRFGRLTVIERDCGVIGANAYWICKCDCGGYSVVRGSHLTSGRTKSCGCLEKENLKRIGKASKHGKRKERIYSTWCKMKERCCTETSSSYSNYGGRGISVCGEWKNNFQTFYDWAMANGYSDDLTIDRIDVNGNYEPSNCRWVTHKEQANNTRKNRFITHNGETHTLAEWADASGLKYDTFYRRLKEGWSMDEIINTPVKKK